MGAKLRVEIFWYIEMTWYNERLKILNLSIYASSKNISLFLLLNHIDPLSIRWCATVLVFSATHHSEKRRRIENRERQMLVKMAADDLDHGHRDDLRGIFSHFRHIRRLLARKDNYNWLQTERKVDSWVFLDISSKWNFVEKKNSRRRRSRLW